MILLRHGRADLGEFVAARVWFGGEDFADQGAHTSSMERKEVERRERAVRDVREQLGQENSAQGAKRTILFLFIYFCIHFIFSFNFQIYKFEFLFKFKLLVVLFSH